MPEFSLIQGMILFVIGLVAFSELTATVGKGNPQIGTILANLQCGYTIIGLITILVMIVVYFKKK